MKLYKDYNKKPYSFLLNNTTLPSGSPLRFKKTWLEMTVNEKNKTINNEIENNKAQYSLDKKTANIWLNYQRIMVYEFVTDEDVFVFELV